MSQAKQRNPNIKLYGLPWAFPAWVGNFTGNPYNNLNTTADYIIKWVEGAKFVYGLDIDYVVRADLHANFLPAHARRQGIWNERSYNITYIETLRASLDAAGFVGTQIVAPDLGWEIAAQILEYKALDEAVYAIGWFSRHQLLENHSSLAQGRIIQAASPRHWRCRRGSRCGPARTCRRTTTCAAPAAGRAC